ncbi:MAG: gamma-glutamyl-gamma-aminobutyrate hydrolase family protein [Planctomycetota bacterium]|nr:gamma-glutamyl-gamma-aminobutyrate hydrolase family protein [Planctomycetota bacterium]
MTTSHRPPIVGITCDLTDPPSASGVTGRPRAEVRLAYARCVAAAGGLPVLLAPIVALIPDYLRLCDAFVFTGGDDPRTEAFGVPTHPKAKPMHPDRQAFELGLIDALNAARREAPVLGVCLGMQLMTLHAGGRMNQHLPDTLGQTADAHWNQQHPVIGAFGKGLVDSMHRQAMETPGTLEVLALSPDGLIEAVRDPARNHYVGVQWHPERTPDPALGQALFDALVRATGKA